VRSSPVLLLPSRARPASPAARPAPGEAAPADRLAPGSCSPWARSPSYRSGARLPSAASARLARPAATQPADAAKAQRSERRQARAATVLSPPSAQQQSAAQRAERSAHSVRSATKRREVSRRRADAPALQDSAPSLGVPRGVHHGARSRLQVLSFRRRMPMESSRKARPQTFAAYFRDRRSCLTTARALLRGVAL
jgi:hypothetical protein